MLAGLGCMFEIDAYTLSRDLAGRTRVPPEDTVGSLLETGSCVYFTSDGGQQATGNPFLFAKRVLEDLEARIGSVAARAIGVDTRPPSSPPFSYERNHEPTASATKSEAVHRGSATDPERRSRAGREAQPGRAQRPSSGVSITLPARPCAPRGRGSCASRRIRRSSHPLTRDELEQIYDACLARPTRGRARGQPYPMRRSTRSIGWRGFL